MKTLKIRVTDDMYAGIEANAAEMGVTIEESAAQLIYAELFHMEVLQREAREAEEKARARQEATA